MTFFQICKRVIKNQLILLTGNLIGVYQYFSPPPPPPPPPSQPPPNSLRTSVADPERFDPDPDPNLYLVREKTKIFFKIFNYFFQNLTKLVVYNFPSNNYLIDDEGEGVRDAGRGKRGEVLVRRDEGGGVRVEVRKEG